jgi:hypothetical protein
MGWVGEKAKEPLPLRILDIGEQKCNACAHDILDISEEGCHQTAKYRVKGSKSQARRGGQRFIIKLHVFVKPLSAPRS